MNKEHLPRASCFTLIHLSQRQGLADTTEKEVLISSVGLETKPVNVGTTAHTVANPVPARVHESPYQRSQGPPR